MVLYHYKYVDIAHKHKFNNIYSDNIAHLFCIYNNWSMYIETHAGNDISHEKMNLV